MLKQVLIDVKFIKDKFIYDHYNIETNLSLNNIQNSIQFDKNTNNNNDSTTTIVKNKHLNIHNYNYVNNLM